MESADEAEWRQLLSWLREVRDAGAFPTLAMPYVLLHRPAEAAKVAEMIASDLDSEVEGGVAAAAQALRHWVHLSAASLVSAPPSTLISALVGRVIFRRKPGIISCLHQLAFLIAEGMDAITPQEAALVTASLVAWHHATALPVQDDTLGDFHEAERPDLRVLVGRLAGALRIWHAKSSPERPEPSSVALWRDSCASDALPEVRRAFVEYDSFGQ
jgi:hypothetical protein